MQLMKNIALVIFASFLFVFQGVAQKTISKTDFEHLVDYVNCKYTARYIEQFRSDINERNNIDKYDKHIKPSLNDASIGRSPQIDELKTLLINNGWSKTCNELTQKVDDKKKKFNGNEMSVTDAIDLLKLDGKIGEQLVNEEERLRTEILTHYKLDEEDSESSKNIEKDYSGKKDNSSIDMQKQYDDLKDMMKWLILIFSAILILFLIILIRLSKKVGRESIVKIVLNSSRINDKFAPKPISQSTKNVRNATLTEREINTIVDKVQECLRLNDKEIKQSISKSENIPPTLVSTPTYKYLKGKKGKTFSRVENTPEDSFFRILNESGDTADFEFHGNEEEAIAKRIFHEDICTILSGNALNAHSIKTVMLGRVKRIGEQWTVIEPIKIILT